MRHCIVAVFTACVLSAQADVVSFKDAAKIENFLYFDVYIPKDKLCDGIVQYRVTVCTLLHVGCVAISSCGLVRSWREAKKGLCAFSAATVTSYLVVAMVVHGLYNAAATLFSFAEIHAR